MSPGDLEENFEYHSDVKSNDTCGRESIFENRNCVSFCTEVVVCWCADISTCSVHQRHRTSDRLSELRERPQTNMGSKRVLRTKSKRKPNSRVPNMREVGNAFCGRREGVENPTDMSLPFSSTTSEVVL